MDDTPKKHPPKTGAERQREYRRRHSATVRNPHERVLRDAGKIGMMPHFDLQSLAECYGVTQRAVLEHLIAAEVRRIARPGEIWYGQGKTRDLPKL